MFEIRTILYPTDFSHESAAALGVACSLAQKHGAEVVVLHVIPPMPMEDLANEALGLGYDEQVMDQYLRPISSPVPGVRVRHQLERGEPAELIVSVAEDLGCDLIVMGTHGRGGLSRLFMGSVTEQVLRNAPCPVLAVREPPVPEVLRKEARHQKKTPAAALAK